MLISQIEDKCKELRSDIIKMIGRASSGHPGGSLSAVEILACLYYYKMKIDPQNPNWEDRDRFVLSKGHAAPAYYAVLADKGFFHREELLNFRQLRSILQGHPDAKKTPGVDASTGSLGQGLSIAVGMALGARLRGKDINVYALLGDGELQEGQVWEAFMSAAHYRLLNLTVLIDNNGLQLDGSTDEVMSLGNIKEKLMSFGFECIEVDGHSIPDIIRALDLPASKPKCILCKTVKGKGVSFMENQVGWHGKAPSREEAKIALSELGGITDGTI